MKDKRVLITGAARGIGKGIAETFLAEGAKAVLLDRRKEDLERTAYQFRQEGWPVDCVVCDLNDPEKLHSAVELAWNSWGGMDVLINNAGIAARESFIDIEEDAWRKVMNVNLNATFLLSQDVARRMIHQGSGGAIVNMASKNGLAGSGKLAHYNASKAGVHLLTQSMAVELAKYEIRVNAVAPGFIETPLDRELKQNEDAQLSLTEKTPMQRLGTVQEAANAFLFLASNEASYITGTTLVVDGGHLANASEF